MSDSLFETIGSSAGFGTVPSISQSIWENIYDEDDDYADDVETSDKYYNNKDCVIFLIDSQDSMFVPNERDEIPFQNAIRCAIATMTDKIISSDTDLLGICFYGTKQKKNLNEFDSIYVLQDLEVPDAQRILELEGLLKHETSPFGVCETEFPFCDALWTCSTMFSNCTVKVGHKRIFLFTNEDNPNANDTNIREQCIQRAKDLSELGIDIELFGMNNGEKSFDISKFYQNIISVDEEDFTGDMTMDASAKFEELRARVRRKEFKKRSLGKIPLILRPGLQLGVRLYSLIKEAKKGTHIWLDNRKNQRVKIASKYVCEATGSLLMPNQIGYYYNYGGAKIPFTSEELKQIKGLSPKGIHLMGFKPMESLKDYHSVREASFIYPDDSLIKGSTTLFAALLDRMLEKRKIAVAKFVPRDNAMPRFVALYPQEEEFDEDGTQLVPPGLHVIYLPFADEIRELDLFKSRPANEDQLNLAKQVVKKLRIRFDSRSFENPILQKHYAALQALALEREQVEAVPDYVLPDTEGMDKFSNLVTELKTAVFGEENEESKDVRKIQGASNRKRKRDGETDEKKKVRKVNVLDDEDYADESKVKKLTIPDLKAYLKGKGIAFSSSDRKPALVSLVVNAAKVKTEQ